MEKGCGLQGGLCYKINLIWSYSIRVSLLDNELFSQPLCVYIYIYIYIYTHMYLCVCVCVCMCQYQCGLKAERIVHLVLYPVDTVSIF